ncbi:MAG: ParM/StbA family protein [Deltaproteobacteria bacterium]|nr:ParM/StbA family protein [Deltaproteobacteria bacterium]
MIAVEVGFSSVKVKHGNYVFSFASAIVEEIGSMSFGKFTPGVYEFERRRFLVGDRALVRPDQNYKLELDWLIEKAPLFVFHALALARCENEDTIVVGLPPEYFFGNMDRLRQRLSSFAINGKQYGFKRVYVMAQGVGSFYDYCNMFPPKESDNSLLVDIGANTINAMIAFGDEVSPEESIQFTRSGACIAAKEVIATLRSKDITISQSQAHIILKSGTHNGEPIDNIAAIISNFAQHTLDLIYNEYANHTLTRIILTGGGADLIKNHLPESHQLIRKLCYVNDPVYSNVRGYYLVGLSRVVEHNL